MSDTSRTVVVRVAYDGQVEDLNLPDHDSFEVDDLHGHLVARNSEDDQDTIVVNARSWVWARLE